MAFIRCCIISAVITLCIGINAGAQSVYYPAQSSKLLKATAEDMAALLNKAVAGGKFTAQPYTIMPSTGVILVYDNSITDNQACRVKSDGSASIVFTAAEDNGLHFGIYQYLNDLGFRFYQPGSIWEITPSLAGAYTKKDTVYTCAYKYKTWFVSGGHNRWIMDNTNAYSWDTYFGENGHNWALYQRRNGMMGAMRFAGHRDDIMRGDYLTALQNNPCYVANYNGSRQASYQSVPDINNAAAKQLWAEAIEKKHTSTRNNIFSNTGLYTDIYRNFKYSYEYIGLEVPDGAKFGNSKDNETCGAVDYPKESDQHFAIADYTAQKILSKYPDKHFQLYAYSGHADVPSAGISISKNIDVQLIPTVYQMESSTNGLRNRWYNRFSNVSEYLYLNLSDWSGETPSFSWDELKNTLQIAKDKKSQGIIWEASPSKFGSLPYLLAANANLKDGTPVDNTLKAFCDNMFAGAASTVYQILQQWGDEKTKPNRYKMEIYLQLLGKADAETRNAPEIVKERIRELKAYLHYMVMYYDLEDNDQAKISKESQDAAICLYLAKTNRMQLVNSYYVITMIVSKYGSNSDFYTKYNVVNGTAYANGTLPLITAAEIEDNFKNDLSRYGSRIKDFTFTDAAAVRNAFKQAGIAPLAKINLQLAYTNGINYYNKTTFNIIAPAAGKFTIDYAARFDMPGQGYMNFLVESTDKALQVIKDFSIGTANGSGAVTVNLPAAGNYLLTVISKYKTAATLGITTNGNYFYKKGAFLGNKTESYRNDPASLPGFFYIPAGVNRIYFSAPNYSNGKYAVAETIANSFGVKDNNGNAVKFNLLSPSDSSFFYMDIPAAAAGTFWQATSMNQYNLQFESTSNLLWYAQKTDQSKKNGAPENASSSDAVTAAAVPVIFPNPSSGVFNCMLNGAVVKADVVEVYNLTGIKVGTFRATSQFNISNMAAGLYLYKMAFNDKIYQGKIIKL